MKRAKRPLPNQTSTRQRLAAKEALSDGFAAHQAGRLEDAAGHYRTAIEAQPDEPDALHLLGMIAYQKGDLPQAVALIGRAIRSNPRHPAYYSNLGMAHKDLGDLTNAEAAQRRAIGLKPDFAEAHNNLGVVLAARGCYAEATQCFGRAITLSPEYADAYLNLGMALAARGRPSHAVAALRKALALRPESAMTLASLGAVLGELGDGAEAVACLNKAIELAPESPQALAFRGVVLARAGETEQALADLGRAVQLKPDLAQARFHLCMAQIPILYQHEQDISARRTNYETSLRELDTWCSQSGGDALMSIVQAIGSAQPFHLAYQGRNDRELQSVYGSMICRIMARAYPQWAERPEMPPRDDDGRIRIGIVSGFFRRHSNWKLPIKGWVHQLDRSRFVVHGYHTQDTCDDQTRDAADCLDGFVQGPLDLEQWCARIRQDRLHMLVFPEVGMDPMTPKLAALRLAPVQCASWGHPMTTGLPTIDYFLSSELMEPEGSQEHYTETLVRLPNLSVYHLPLPTVPSGKTREDFGLPADAVLYWCCQSLYKYLPQHDDVFARIAARVPQARFVFLRYPEPSPITGQFVERLTRAFARHGLLACAHCVFLPRLGAEDFAAATSLMDVFLDSVGWSGCNSALQAIEAGLPVVTVEGRSMRANHSAAILRMMEEPATVGHTVDDYVEIGAELGAREDWRREVSRRVAAKRGRIYRDVACVQGLEAFVERVCAGAPGAGPDGVRARGGAVR